MAVRPSAAILVSRQLVQDCIRLYPANKEYYSVFCELMATKTAFDLTDTLYNSASMRIHGCFFNPGGVSGAGGQVELWRAPPKQK